MNMKSFVLFEKCEILLITICQGPIVQIKPPFNDLYMQIDFENIDLLQIKYISSYLCTILSCHRKYCNANVAPPHKTYLVVAQVTLR